MVLEAHRDAGRTMWSRSSGSAASSTSLWTHNDGASFVFTWTTYCWLEHTTKTDALLGTTLVKTKEGTTSELMLLWTAYWRISTCPRSRAHQHCSGNAVRQKRRSRSQANEVHGQLVGKLIWIDWADMRCAMVKASSGFGRASDTDMRNIESILRYFSGNPGIMRVRRRHSSWKLRKDLLRAQC